MPFLIKTKKYDSVHYLGSPSGSISTSTWVSSIDADAHFFNNINDVLNEIEIQKKKDDEKAFQGWEYSIQYFSIKEIHEIKLKDNLVE